MEKIALLMQSAANGGVQRVMINLARGLVDKGVNIDFIICDARGEMLSDIPEKCNIVDYEKQKYYGDLKVATSFFEILRYMKEHPETVMIGAPGLAGTILAFAKILRKKSRVLVIFDNKCSLLKGKSIYHTIIYYINKIILTKVDGIVAAHRAASEDIIEHCNIPKSKMHVIYHPLIDFKRIKEAIAEIEHPYIGMKNEYKLLIAVGRIVPEKDYINLVSAFSKLRKNIKVKLIILGEGPLKEDIQAHIRSCGVEEDVELFGYTSKVFEFMKAADAVVLSSKQEAFGNVLIEALACGVPIIATDCESGGPRDILDGDNAAFYGALCQPNNSSQLANAIETVLSTEYDLKVLKQRADLFTIEHSSEQYLKIIRGLH